MSPYGIAVGNGSFRSEQSTAISAMWNAVTPLYPPCTEPNSARKPVTHLFPLLLPVRLYFIKLESLYFPTQLKNVMVVHYLQKSKLQSQVFTSIHIFPQFIFTFIIPGDTPARKLISALCRHSVSTSVLILFSLSGTPFSNVLFSSCFKASEISLPP